MIIITVRPLLSRNLFNIFPAENESAFDLIDNSPRIRNAALWAFSWKFNIIDNQFWPLINSHPKNGMIKNNANIKVHWVDTEKIDQNSNSKLLFKNIDGILIPGGFGDRGIEGKILSSKYAREQSIPFFGICLGLQCAIIDIGTNTFHLLIATKSKRYPIEIVYK